jgi:hypothetical protein
VITHALSDPISTETISKFMDADDESAVCANANVFTYTASDDFLNLSAYPITTTNPNRINKVKANFM